MNLALFTYNFPHKKSHDFLISLMIDGLKPSIVIAQDYTDLSIPKPTLRVRPIHKCLIHPKIICDRFKIKFIALNHNSEETQRILKENKIDIGVITGSRILKQKTIESVKKGIINFHLGIIPQHRGLDGLQWSIFEGKPLGVTAHVIEENIDAGFIIEKKLSKKRRMIHLLTLACVFKKHNFVCFQMLLKDFMSPPLMNFQK